MYKPALWVKFSKTVYQDAEYTLNNFLKYMKWKPEQSERALELGCGAGNITKEILIPSLPKNVHEVICIDESEEMIKYAKENSAHEKIKYIVMNVYDMDHKLGRNSFDHVFAFHVMHWLMDKRKACRNIYEVLKPGSDGLLQQLAEFPFLDVFIRNAQKSKYRNYMKQLEHLQDYKAEKKTRDALLNIYKEAGLNTVVCEYKNMEFTFPDDDFIKGFMASIDPSLDSMPSILKEEYKQEFTDDLKKELGGYLMPYKILISCIKKPES